MDLQELLNVADDNKVEAEYEASVKRYSSVLPPPKKVPKSNVQSESIRRFLEKRKAEEAAKAAEARKQKEKLLALRAQNSKNNKKAKIMASRTKDNDFSRIKLTDDEIEAKKRREAELLRQNLANKVERMKARIEMEEKEKLLPRKRKRKSKNGEPIERDEPLIEEQQDDYRDPVSDIQKNHDKNPTHKSNGIRKPSKPPPSALSFNELLKLANQKKNEPLEMIVKKKEEEKLMTKKEKKLLEEERARERRKQERLKETLLQGVNSRTLKSNSTAQSVNKNKKNISEKSKKPVVIHVEREVSKPVPESPKLKVPKISSNSESRKNIPSKSKQTTVNGMPHKSSAIPNVNSHAKLAKQNNISESKKTVKCRDETSSSLKDAESRKKFVVPKKNGLKINPVSSAPAVQPPVPKIDQEALTAEIERRIREKIEKEMEEKLAARFGLHLKNASSPAPTKDSINNKKVSEAPKQSIVKKQSVMNNGSHKVPDKPVLNKKDAEKMLALKKRAMEQKNLMLKAQEKKAFHKNPYLEPPRRLLEPQRPMRPPPKRKIESDDDDDDDEDEMSDFIDDSPSQNEENYSKYIKEIFGYDRNRYVDIDDDDIMESSFAEQMKEEVRSARLGYLEDLEEEKLERERKKKKKLKK